MADYSHLKKLDVNEQTTAEYIFEDIPGEPSIIFAPMTDSNPDYLNERVRIAVERAEADQANTKAKRREKILSSARLDEEREIDRELMARTCAKGWGNPPKDEKGKTHQFSADECLSFLRALPNYMFEPCRNFVGNTYNFVPKDGLADVRRIVGDAENLGNGSPPDSSGFSDSTETATA